MLSPPASLLVYPSFDSPFLFSSKVTVVLIRHAIVDTTVNLSSEKIGKSLSRLIYETSLTIDTSAKSNVKGSLVTFVRGTQWIQPARGFPVKEKQAVFAVCETMAEPLLWKSLINSP